MSSLDQLWAGWKLANYPERGGDGLRHANVAPVDGRSLFERIEQSGLADDQTYIVWRGASTFAILNVFPYTSGHVMVLPLVAHRSVLDLADDLYDELWRAVRAATTAVNRAFNPAGVNIGVNEGTAGGGSVPEHLHVHVVPRWSADTNFMTTTANTRVLPQTLQESWAKLRDAWPT
ncbi:MAG: HIT domain-containing protein [Acidimicrobiales bacterium]